MRPSQKKISFGPCNSSINILKVFASPPSLHSVIKDTVLTGTLDRDR